MGKGSFRAFVALGALVPIAVAVTILLHPKSRAAVSSFFAPLPTATYDAGIVTLPPLSGALGAESVELRTLREDASVPTKDRKLHARPALFDREECGGGTSVDARSVRPAGLRRPDIMARDDASIDRAVQHLTTDPKTRERFIEALKRSGRSSTEVVRILRAWRLSDALVAVVFVESGFQPTLASEDRGMGLWQITPDVAHVYGLSMLSTYDERRGVASGTEAAARYLSDLHERFGSWELALVSYAMGYARTLDVLERQASVDYRELEAALPCEAKSYVADVLGTALLLQNLDRFGLDTVTRDAVASTSDLDVTAGTSLTLVARAAGISADSLHDLNPEYGSDTVPSTSFRMTVHVPSGAFTRARELLPLLQTGKDIDSLEAAPEDASGPDPVLSRGVVKRMFYRVREGDTLPSLAREHHLSIETLSSDNALDPTSSLSPGTILVIRLETSTDASPLEPRFPEEIAEPRR